MDDAEYATQKARVERYTEGWVHILHMGGWHADVCWHREKAEDSKENLRPAMMEAEARWQYNDFTLHVYLPSVAEVEDDATIEMIVVHEYQHALLNELRPPSGRINPDYLQHEEHAATMLAKAFIEVRNRAQEEATVRRESGEELPGPSSPNGHGEGEEARCEVSAPATRTASWNRWPGTRRGLRISAGTRSPDG